MADTYGLLKTRGEWTNAVSNGETNLTHAEWYKQKKLKEKVTGQKEEQPTLAQLAIRK